MEERVDKALYESLRKRNPEEVSFTPFCLYNEDDECYLLDVWGGKYAVYPHSAKVEVVKGYADLHEFFYIFLVNYLLLDNKTAKPVGEWISEKDLPGGTTFFRGPHEIPTNLISESYNNDLLSLKKKCEEQGGAPLEFADLSYQFEIIGGIQVALLFWQGDDEFPAEAKVLIDKSIKDVPLDIVYALLCEVCSRMKK
jgi:hypothetical protein